MGATAGINGDLWLSTSPSTPLLPLKDTTSNSSTSSGASLTWSHTVGAASNMALVVAVIVGGSDTCSGVTYAGSSMTQIGSPKNQGTETLYLFYKLAPATGANNVVASFSGSAAGIGLGVSYSNVYQASPFGTPASSSGGSGNSSNTVVSTSTSQLVLDINFANGSSSSVGASQNVETSNSAVAPFYFADIDASGGSMPLSWTNAGSPTIWIEMSVALNGAPVVCTDSGDHQHYQTSQVWDPTQTFVVQTSPDGVTWTTALSSTYTVYWPVGSIIFNSVLSNTHVQILRGNYFTLTTLDGSHKWAAQIKALTKDTTPFQSAGGWGQNTATTKQTTFNADCYRQDARVLQEMITGGGATNISNGIVLAQLWWDKTNGKRFQFYALPTQVGQTVAANDVNKQNVAFQATGPVYIVTSNSLGPTTITQL